MRLSVVQRCSPLRTATESLRDAFFSHKAINSLAAKWSAAEEAGRNGATAALASFDTREPITFLPPDGRRQITIASYNKEKTETISLPTAADFEDILGKETAKLTAPERLEKLEQFLQKFTEDSASHVAMLAAWGPKTFNDAAGEYAEVGAIMSMALQAFRSGLESENGQFEPISSAFTGKLCVVIPPSNFALLALKDAVHMTLEGYRVVLVCQPRFFPHFHRIQEQFRECGIDSIDIAPGISPEADPTVLDALLRQAHRLQFTGSSNMFRSLRRRALELGNKKLVAAGEVSGINKVELHGVSAAHPAPQMAAAWASVANHGELCTSCSLIEFDPTVDTTDKVKAALDEVTFEYGNYDAPLLKREEKGNFEVKTESERWPREWWGKQVLVSPRGGEYPMETSLSLGHCVYAKTITDALNVASSSQASNVYLAGCPSEGPFHRVGTTGAQLPESCFGGMKTYTQAVAGDHHGVGTLQQLLSTLKRRSTNYKDREEHFYEYEMSDRAEDLMSFLESKDQQPLADLISSLLEITRAFEPAVIGPYDGQALVGGDGRSQLHTVKAWKRTNLHVLVPNASVLPDDIAKLAVIWEMLPIKGGSVTIHVFVPDERITCMKDPLKSFVKCVKKLGWTVHEHKNQWEGVKEKLVGAPYFVGCADARLLPDDVLAMVIDNGGHIEENGIPSEPLALFRMLTTTQAITSAGENVVQQAALEFPDTYLRKVFIPEPFGDEFGDEDVFDSSDSDGEDEATQSKAQEAKNLQGDKAEDDIQSTLSQASITLPRK